MPLVVGVKFKDTGKIYYFDPGEIQLRPKDKVLVETVRGMEIGIVIVGPKEVPEEKVVLPLKKVVRLATEEDLQVEERNRKKAKEAMEVARKKIEEHNLDMHLVDSQYAFDGSRITFYFTADGRIDFRDLVKDLASALRTRVELRQIGVRDEAKMIGGIGPCGRLLCCATFLNDFQPVSIKMAKDQNLSLNPAKISGLCGRLLCCLRFECQYPEKTKSDLPPVGALVITPEGEGKVKEQNISKGTLAVELENGEIIEFPPEEIEEKKC